MKLFFPKTFFLIPILIGLFCFSCAPKYGAYFAKQTYEDNNYAKINEKKVDNSTTASIEPVENAAIDIIEPVDAELLKTAVPKKVENDFAVEIPKVAPEREGTKEKGKLVLIEKEDKNAQMTSREEMIMDALKIKLQNMTKAEKKAFRKDVKLLAKSDNIERLSSAANISSPENLEQTDTSTLLLVIIAFLLPPLAVFLHQGEINENFWINLLLTLLFYIPGLIHALILIL